MVRTILAVIGLFAIVSLGGVAFVGYQFYQTATHAMAAASAIKSALPPIPKQPGGKQPAAGFPPVVGTPSPWLPAFPTPPATKHNGKHHRYNPQRPAVPPMPPFPPGRP